jgi:hypothetical protein
MHRLSVVILDGTLGFIFAMPRTRVVRLMLRHASVLRGLGLLSSSPFFSFIAGGLHNFFYNK